MKPPLARRRVVAGRLERRLADWPNVVAVLVFGSVASGNVDETSDIDVLVICEPNIPSAAVRRARLRAEGKSWTFGAGKSDALFSVVDEGISPDNVPVTLHYQRVGWIDAVLEEVLEHGAISTAALPFRPYTLPGLLERAWILADERRIVAAWQARIVPFPLVLRRNLLGHFVPQLREHTDELLANTQRQLGPVTYLFNLNWAVDAMASILYAINGRYDPADRRAERTVLPHLERAPQDFSARLEGILIGPFDDRTAVQKARLFAALADEVLALTETL